MSSFDCLNQVLVGLQHYVEDIASTICQPFTTVTFPVSRAALFVVHVTIVVVSTDIPTPKISTKTNYQIVLTYAISSTFAIESLRSIYTPSSMSSIFALEPVVLTIFSRLTCILFFTFFPLIYCRLLENSQTWIIRKRYHLFYLVACTNHLRVIP